MSKRIFTYTIITGLSLLTVPIQSFGQTSGRESLNRSAMRQERRADSRFIKGDYNKAQLAYQRANEKLSAGVQRQRLELKMARLHILLQEPKAAIRYYKAVQNAADSLLTVNDICFYLDALRQNGDAQQAEIVARQYAFRSPYERNQRFHNTLNALSSMRYYYAKGDSDYAVKLFLNTPDLSEYWIGHWKGSSFYAASQSRIQDPQKIFYHRTKYFNLHGNKAAEPFRNIPLELQSGPVAFSDDGKLMVATGISYRKKDRILDISNDRAMFTTQLYYSVISDDGKRWSSFKPIFEAQDEYCYAHPSFFNEGNSLIFASDRPGGFGGMDLYFTHWDPEKQCWSEPVNLGKDVNTEGDEIYPSVIGDGLYFSSNGQAGHGGYDIYRVSFGYNIVLPGSLFHYPFPINTAYNDFGTFFENGTGYFISDRHGVLGKDDIYIFDSTISPLGSENAIGISEEYSAMAGNLNTVTGLKSSNTETFRKELPLYSIPVEGELILSVYFDFNGAELDAEATEVLRRFLDNPAVSGMAELSIVGYADEFGSEQYNKNLSEKRAESVARFLKNGGIKAAVTTKGLGKLLLSQAEYREEQRQDEGYFLSFPVDTELRRTTEVLSFQERVRINRKVRRVDITVKKNK